MFPQSVLQLLGVFQVLVADRQDSDLDRSQPGGECTPEVLDQVGNEALVGAEWRTVDHIRMVFLAIRADVHEVHTVAAWYREVELVGAEGLLATGDSA